MPDHPRIVNIQNQIEDFREYIKERKEAKIEFSKTQEKILQKEEEMEKSFIDQMKNEYSKINENE